jgi:hypothetical protein
MTSRNPYGRGFDAGLGIGEYQDSREVPDCPYPVASRDAKSWHAGYHDGADAKSFDGAHRHHPGARPWSVQR